MSEKIPVNRFINRFSILLATLAIFFATQYLIPLETSISGTNMFGFMLNFDFAGLVPWVLALLCAAGCFWLFVTHPDREMYVGRPWMLLPNVILPSMATLISSTLLMQLERNPFWWVALGISLVVIGVIINAEYQVLGMASDAYKVVAPVLISLSFGLFLALNVSLAASSLRMYVQVLLIFVSAAFVSFRTIHLRTNGQIEISSVLLCSLLVAEIAGAMYYLFLKPIQFALIVSGMLYILTSVVIIEEPLTRRKLTEPLIMAVMVTVLFLVVSLT